MLFPKLVNAQQEFFGDTNGMTLSGSTNFDGLYGGGIDFYFKHNVIISGLIADYNGYNMLGAGVNFLITGNDYNNPTKGIFGFSYTVVPDKGSLFGLNAGLVQVLNQKSNYPFSLSAIANVTLAYGVKVVPSISYTQAFFSNKQIYPVFGLSYEIPLDRSYYSDNVSALMVHIGLNIKLDKDTKK